MTELALKDQQCEEITKATKPLIIPTIEGLIQNLDQWQLALSYIDISKTFKFKNYHHTVAFVNAVSWIAQKADHHPEICFGYNECKITLSSHAAKGLTKNDFIVAAKIDALLQ